MWARRAFCNAPSVVFAGSEALPAGAGRPVFLPVKTVFLEPFQAAWTVWNRLKRRFFLLHPAAVLNIDGIASPWGCRFSMIVCSCNVLTDHDVRSAVSAADNLPRNAKQVYGCLGCSAECGRCARTIKSIIDEALGECAKACCSGCPHSQATDAHTHSEFAFAAG
jgi:bacterioferritin-associated ferredoxin